jgi:hypothetical protein
MPWHHSQSPHPFPSQLKPLSPDHVLSSHGSLGSNTGNTLGDLQRLARLQLVGHRAVVGDPRHRRLRGGRSSSDREELDHRLLASHQRLPEFLKMVGLDSSRDNDTTCRIELEQLDDDRALAGILIHLFAGIVELPGRTEHGEGDAVRELLDGHLVD